MHTCCRGTRAVVGGQWVLGAEVARVSGPWRTTLWNEPLTVTEPDSRGSGPWGTTPCSGLLAATEPDSGISAGSITSDGAARQPGLPTLAANRTTNAHPLARFLLAAALAVRSTTAW